MYGNGINTNRLQELLSSGGLGRVSKELLQVASPSIRLTAHPGEETQLRLGRTKLGGSPDMPKGMKWPEHNGSALPFVAQINLAEAAPFDMEHLFPATGILYFFFDQGAYFECQSIDKADTWHVYYTPTPFFDLQRLTIPESIARQERYRPSEFTSTAEITLPEYSQYDSTSIERLGLPGPLTDEEENAYHQIQAQLAGRSGARFHIPLHRLLGHPDGIQWDMHEELEGVSTDWQLLFQVDTDDVPGTEWGDTGRIYYWIRTCDLAESNFSRVQVILQS